MTDRIAAIASAFGAARDYDRHAHVQRRAAEALADRVAALGLNAPRLLEFGCGTGFLTEALSRRDVGGKWLITDLSPDMVERCRARMDRRGDMIFSVLDVAAGEPEGSGSFDIVTASLAAQWLVDLEGSVERMLAWVKPGGHVLFNTLASGTFHEWREALAQAGLAGGTPPYPAIEALAAIRPEAQASAPAAALLEERHADARAFLGSLKAIGAHVPAPGHRPASAGQMRTAMRAFDAKGAAASYEIVTLHFRRPLETAR